MSSTTPSSSVPSFYTHETDLFSPTNPGVSLKSTRFPQLEVRTPKPADAPELLQCFLEPENTKFDKSCEGLDSLDSINNIIKTWSTYPLPPEPLTAVNNVVVINGHVRGISGLGEMTIKPDGTKLGDAGIMISPSERGKGFAVETLRMVYDHAFRVLGMDRVDVSSVKENMPMQGLMEGKFGLKRTFIVDKRFGNDYQWEMTKEEWMKKSEGEKKQ